MYSGLLLSVRLFVSMLMFGCCEKENTVCVIGTVVIRDVDVCNSVSWLLR